MRPRSFGLACCIGIGLSVPRAADIPFTRVVVDASSPKDPWMKALGDFTGDGYPDIMVCGAAGPLVLYAYPDWKKSTIAAEASSESGSAVADIDGDGDQDIVIGTDWFENPLSGGKPGPVPWARHSLGDGGTHDIAAADIDKDGKTDIIMRGESSHDLYLFRQAGPDAWVRKVVPHDAGYNGLAVRDIDKDGDVDIVLPGAWLENPGGDFGKGEWAAHRIGAWDDFAAIQAGDLNGDGRPDVVMTVSESDGWISWFECPADPKTGKWTEHKIDAGPITNAHAVEIADIDRDGEPDVITSEYEGQGRLLIYRNAGKGASWTRQAVGSDKLHNIRLADFGKDGDLDIVGVYAWGINPVVLWRNDLPPTSLLPMPPRRGPLPAHVQRNIAGRRLPSRSPASVIRVTAPR